MKIKITMRPITGPVCPVWFEFDDDQAHTVAVSGNFGPPYLTPIRMAPAGPGRWIRALFLKPGRYQYCFMVDGRRVLDPRAKQSALNAEGKAKSVLLVKPAARKHNLLALSE